VGIGVALLIMWAGIGIARDTMEPLVGAAVPKEVYEQITEFVESYEGILGTHDLIVHNYGPGRSMASVHAEVPNSVDVEISHEIIDRIEGECLKELGIFLVIHMDPLEVDNEELDKVKKKLIEALGEIDGALSIHDFRMVKGEEQINLIFDLVVPLTYTKEKRNETCKIIRSHMYALDTRYQCVIQVETGFMAEES
jgi:divalent metal cation (Fe/Co/Zn/Cd) transporter